MLEGKATAGGGIEWTYQVEWATETMYLFIEPTIPGTSSRTHPTTYSFSTIRRLGKESNGFWEEMLRVIDPYDFTVNTN